MKVSKVNSMNYCAPDRGLAQMLTASIAIFRQCGNMDDEDLVLTVTPEDQLGGQGLQQQITELYVPVLTAASGQPIQNLRNGYNIINTVAIQKGATDPRWDVLTSGFDAIEDSSRSGGAVVEFANRVGEAVRRYSVMITVFNGGIEIYTDELPNCEIMMSSQTAMTAGQNFSKTMTMTAMQTSDGLYMIRHFLDGSSAQYN